MFIKPVEKLKSKDFVIVENEGEFFPGVTLQLDLAEKRAQVDVMVMSGPHTQKWPEKKDILWYPLEDVREIIKPPKTQNATRLLACEVPEIKKYRQN